MSKQKSWQKKNTDWVSTSKKLHPFFFAFNENKAKPGISVVIMQSIFSNSFKLQVVTTPAIIYALIITQTLHCHCLCNIIIEAYAYHVTRCIDMNRWIYFLIFPCALYTQPCPHLNYPLQAFLPASEINGFNTWNFVDRIA